MTRKRYFSVLAFVIVLAAGTDGLTQEPFYQGKVLKIIEAYSAGGSYDALARLIARHLGKFIPGKPTTIVTNMTGAGGLIAVNHLYGKAAPDGLTIGNWNGSLALQQYLGRPGIKFDASRFEWIGAAVRTSPTCMIAKSTGINTLEEWLKSDKPVKLGGMAPGTTLSDHARVLQEALKLPIQLIEGYKGGAKVRLAIQQGEVDGACGLGWETQKPVWGRRLASVNIVLQAGAKPHPELKSVPMAIEFAKTDEAKQLIKIAIHGLSALGHSYTLPPKTPKDRVATLRKAFEETMQDAEFLAEVEKAKIVINPTPGNELEEIVAGFGELSPQRLARLKSILLPKE